jgi:hypothetical protein
MHEVLVDMARKRGAAKRDGTCIPIDLDGLAPSADLDVDDTLALHGALAKLAATGPHGERHAHLVEWVWFGGMSFTDAATLLGVSRRQAHRDWAWARIWLARELAAE